MSFRLSKDVLGMFHIFFVFVFVFYFFLFLFLLLFYIQFPVYSLKLGVHQEQRVSNVSAYDCQFANTICITSHLFVVHNSKTSNSDANNFVTRVAGVTLYNHHN